MTLTRDPLVIDEPGNSMPTSVEYRHDEHYGCVYLLTCATSGKAYVGQTTTSLDRRWASHRQVMVNPKRTQPITHALRKYSPDDFTKRVLGVYSSQSELNIGELIWAKRLNTFAPHGYNLRAGDGIGSTSEVTRAKMRELMTPERREALAVLYRGRKLSPEAYANSFATRIMPFALRDPLGVLHQGKNVSKFCRENGLEPALVSRVMRGIRTSHQGWHLVKPILSVAIHLGNGTFQCPHCNKVWKSTGTYKANRHASSCATREAAMNEAISLGNLRQEDFAKFRNIPVQKRYHSRSLNPAGPWILLSPNGESVGVKTMSVFCRSQGLRCNKMSEVANGKRAAHKGWRLEGAEPSESKECVMCHTKYQAWETDLGVTCSYTCRIKKRWQKVGTK